MTNIEINSNAVTTHVNAVNKAYRNARASSGKLFKAIYNAREELTSTDWEEFVANVECDRSTINKTVKIAECEFIRLNASQLPVAWSVLHVIATKAQEDDERLKRLLEDGELNTRTTLAGLKALLAPSAPCASTEPEIALLAPSAPCASTEPEITMNTEFFSDEQLAYVRTIKPKFAALGIKVTDTAKKSEEPESIDDAVMSKEVKEAA